MRRLIPLLLLLAIPTAQAVEVGHAVVEYQVNSSSSSGSWSAPANKLIAGTDLVGSTDYILICQALVSGSTTNTTDFSFHVIEDGIGEITASFMRIEPAASATANGHNYTFIAQVTTAATPNDYQWENRGENSNAASTPSFRMVMIALDDLQSGDWAYDNSTTSNANVASGSWTDGASITIGNGTDDYLIVATSHWLMDNTTDDSRHVIDVDGTEYNEVQMQGGDADEEYAVGTMVFVAAAGASVTAKIKVRTTGGVNDNDNTAIFALRLNAFEDYAGVRNSLTPVTITSTDTDFVVETLTHTTDTLATEDWMFFGQAVNDVGEQEKKTSRELADAVGGTIAGIKTDKEVVQNADTDMTQTFIFNEVTGITDAFSLDVDFIAREDNDVVPEPVIVDADIVAFTWELGPVGGGDTSLRRRRN